MLTERFYLLARNAAFFTILISITNGCARKPSQYTYNHRPVGYHWTAKIDPSTHDTVYYGIDPSDGWQVYVGPDNIYYTFKHAGPIEPSDLRSPWAPHNV